jgi:hypothetical protein
MESNTPSHLWNILTKGPTYKNLAEQGKKSCSAQDANAKRMVHDGHAEQPSLEKVDKASVGVRKALT